LKEFVRKVRFDRMGAFTYSEEEGTYAAANYEDSIPQELKQARLDARSKKQILQEIYLNYFTKKIEFIGINHLYLIKVKYTSELITSLLSDITQELQESNAIGIQGFGTFEVKKKSKFFIIQDPTILKICCYINQSRSKKQILQEIYLNYFTKKIEFIGINHLVGS